jgi:hypothetical protein
MHCVVCGQGVDDGGGDEHQHLLPRRFGTVVE